MVDAHHAGRTSEVGAHHGGRTSEEVGTNVGTGLDPHARTAWISTRRGGPAADSMAGNVIGRYVLHDMMRSLTAPLDELSSAHAVVLEAPPIVTQHA